MVQFADQIGIKEGNEATGQDRCRFGMVKLRLRSDADRCDIKINQITLINSIQI